MAIRIAIVLGHDACAGWRDGGAIGLIARDLLDATPPGQEGRIFGPADAVAPLAKPGYAAVAPSSWERWRRPKAAYRAALIRALRRFAPAVIEVHNTRVLSERLARAFPRARAVAVLHSPVALGLTERQAWLAAVHRAVCVSDAVRAQLVAGVPADLAARACTIHNPAPAAPAAAGAERQRIVLFAGRLVPEKGADAFLAAAALLRDRLPGWRVLLAGSEGATPSLADRAYADAVRAEAASAGAEVLGQVPNAELLSLMAQASIVVMPSRYADPFPRVAQEALAAGAALVASPSGGILEAAGDAALYADPERPEEIAAAILRLAEDEAFRAGMTARGRRHLQRFAIGEIMRQWTALRCG